MVLLGAAVVSQTRSAGVSRAAEPADLNKSAPAYDESNSPDTFSAFSMEGSEPDAAAGSVADAPLSSSLKSAMQDSSPLQALSDILLGSGASGSSSLLAHSADELYWGESLILGSSADVVLPASLPVYRNSLLDAADNTDAMKARLRTVLDALGLDTTLADTATFSVDSADTISKTVSDIKESAEQNGWDADSSVLNYLSDAAQLQHPKARFLPPRRLLPRLPRKQPRNIFIRRYWYCDATADIAKRYGIGESKVRVTLHRMRTKLKAYLEKEGVCL